MGGTSLENAELYIKNYGGNEQKISLKDSNTWKTYTIDNIQITNGQCEVGGYTLITSDLLKLIKKNSPKNLVLGEISVLFFQRSSVMAWALSEMFFESLAEGESVWKAYSVCDF